MRLHKALKLLRVSEGKGVREYAAEIGISPATVSRIERGMPCDMASFAKLFAWMIATDKAA